MSPRPIRAHSALLVAAAAASPALASLTLLSGPQQGTHVGNIVTNGSFEYGINPPTDGSGPIDRRFWATGTTLTGPFSVPTGWTSAGAPNTYASWGNDGGPGPYRTQGSAILADGRLGMYFGNGSGVTSTQPATFNSNGTVSFPGTPAFTVPFGAPSRLWQSVPTNTNAAPSYVLSFWASGETSGFPQAGVPDGIFGLRVTNVLAGDPVQYLAVPGGATGSRRFEYSFTPLNTSLPVTVEFINWGHFDFSPFGGSGFTTELVLDDVIVNTVPAPASVALLGLGGLALARRRRATY